MARKLVAASSQYLDSVANNSTNVFSGNKVTLQAWVYLTTINTKYKVAGHWSDANAGEQFLLQITTGNVIQPVVGDGAGAVEACLGATTLSINTWYHIVLVKNGTGASALLGYLNGVQDASGTSNAVLASDTGQPFRVGADPTSAAPSYLDGYVCEVALWNDALSAADITALAAGASALTSRPTNLVGYWPLSSCASPEADATANANSLTNHGTTCIDGPSWVNPKRPEMVRLQAVSRAALT